MSVRAKTGRAASLVKRNYRLRKNIGYFWMQKKDWKELKKEAARCINATQYRYSIRTKSQAWLYTI